MIGQWAIALDLLDGDSAGSLFDRDVEVLESDGRLWLRGNALDEELQKRLHRLPAFGRYSVGSDDILTPQGKQAPTGVLPSGDWQPLEHWLRLKSEVPMLPGMLSKKATLRLIRLSTESPPRNLPHKGEGLEANGLLLNLDRWAKYSETASAIRLSSLLFAADDDRVLVIGKYLPPLPGTRLAILEDIAVPLGWSWSPALPPKVLRNILGAADDVLALWLPGQPVELIPKSSFVAASRSAVRLTVGGADG